LICDLLRFNLFLNDVLLWTEQRASVAMFMAIYSYDDMAIYSYDEAMIVVLYSYTYYIVVLYSYIAIIYMF
jgi:hypothetical protein